MVGGPAHVKMPQMLGLWATQQPQRGTTSCASRPSAGIDRAKCLIPLKATGEQVTHSSSVGGNAE